MTQSSAELSIRLASIYEGTDGDPGFDVLLGQVEFQGDSELADLIESDGRLRLRLGRTVSLDRYLRAVRDLPRRPEPLDAAIDMTLRGMGGDDGTGAIAARLVAQYPYLETPIREAVALGDALFSTSMMQENLGQTVHRELPADFGPQLEDGRARYELRSLLGEGAFGRVYLAVDRLLSEPKHEALVSIKVLRGADRSDWARRRLMEEATKARRIDHANVIRVIDLGVTSQDEDFTVYEYVPGGDLSEWVRHRRAAVRPREAVELMVPIARGVHAAHMAGLVHCDLKPGNIILDESGEPKVADFGIAVRTEEDATGDPQVADGEPLGNLAFMSPEQYRNEPGALNIPSDTYALGGILYWLLTGKLPNGDTPEKIGHAHRDGRASREPTGGRGADSDLCAIVDRALAYRPLDRYGSARALSEDLERWLDRRPIDWTRPSPVRRLVLTCRRRPALCAAFGVIMLLLVGVLYVANERRIESEARRQFTASLQGFTERFREKAREGLGTGVLAQLWIIEWLYGPTVLGHEANRFEIWETRVLTAETLVSRAADHGETDTLHALIWRTSLAWWLLQTGDIDGARGHLLELTDAWRARLEPDDPWLVHMDALLACTELAELLEPGAHADEVALEELAGRIHAARAHLEPLFPDSSINGFLDDQRAILARTRGEAWGEDEEGD